MVPVAESKEGGTGPQVCSTPRPRPALPALWGAGRECMCACVGERILEPE